MFRLHGCQTIHRLNIRHYLRSTSFDFNIASNYVVKVSSRRRNLSSVSSSSHQLKTLPISIKSSTIDFTDKYESCVSISGKINDQQQSSGVFRLYMEHGARFNAINIGIIYS